MLLKRLRPEDLVTFVGMTLVAELWDWMHVDNIQTYEELHASLLGFFTFKGSQYANVQATDLAEELFSFVQQLEEQFSVEQRAKRQEKTIKKLENRIKYCPTVVMSREESYSRQKEETLERWRGFTMLLSDGLLKEVERFYTGKDVPVAFSIQNNLPVEEIEGKVQQRPMSYNALKSLRDQDIAISGYRVAWLKNTLAYKLLMKCFPLHIDFRAYNHSLNAPLLPGGYFPNIPVTLKVITTTDDAPAETDGCGRIHPEHEIFQSLARPGGACTIQFRGINVNGTFIKGILVPDERAVNVDGTPAIWVDWNQVKGAHKKRAQKKLAANQEMSAEFHIGILQAWDRPRKLKWSFQQLQLINSNSETRSIVSEWVEENYELLLGDGLDSLYRSIAARDSRIAMLLKICYAIRNINPEFSPIQVPTIRACLVERLQKTLYFLAQGAGKNGKQAVVAIDAGVPEGTCVIKGFKIGQELILHRYPTILPQGFVKVTVREPLPHHVVNGQILRETIFMNPKDITSKMQGDSDGDIVAVTADKRALKLWDHKLDKNVYLVEPDSAKLNFEDVNQGEDYVMGNPMGPVGLMCILQAQMYAIDNNMAAVAMSIPYQESVDAAKNSLKYKDFPMAEDINNWTLKNGAYSFDMTLTDDPESMQAIAGEWVASKLAEVGITKKNKKSALGWKHPGRRINPETWSTCEERSGWDGGNLVHYAHDYALDLWFSKYREMFELNKPAIDIKYLLQNLNSNFVPLDLDWHTYNRTIRANSGFRTFGKKFYEIVNNPDMDQGEKDTLISSLYYELETKLKQLTFQELECIFRMELTDTYEHIEINGEKERKFYSNEKSAVRVNNPNNAFRAISWEGSPVLEYLGIKSNDQCKFLMGENAKRIPIIINKAFTSEKPFHTLIEMINASTLHEKEVIDENGNPVKGCECHTCTTTLYDNLVQKIRNSKTAVEFQLIRDLCKTLND